MAEMPLVDGEALQPFGKRVFDGALESFLEGYRLGIDPSEFTNALEAGILKAVAELEKLAATHRDQESRGELADSGVEHAEALPLVGHVAIASLCLVAIYTGRIAADREEKEEKSLVT